VPYHRFKIGQTVTAPSPSGRAVSYVIMRLLPALDSKLRYWARSVVDGHERPIPESDITLTSKFNASALGS